MTRRVLLSYLALTTFVLLVLGVPLGVLISRSERVQLVARVERDATVLASVVEDGLQHGVPVPYREVAGTYATRTGARVVIVDGAGIAVGDSDSGFADPRDFSTRPEVMRALAGRISSGYRYSETLQIRLLYVAVPVASGGAVHGAVRITYPTDAVDARIRRSLLTLGAVSAVGLLAATIAGAATASWVTRPVRRLHAAAEEFAAGNLRTRISESAGPPEIRALGRTLDQMAVRLDTLLESQRAFVADASHQLRSPLTALRLRLEGITDVGPRDRVKLEAAIDETARLARLLDGLLTLARVEGSAPAREPVDVAAVVRDRAASWEPLAAESRISIRTDVDGSGVALALPGAVDQILDNYIANALAVAPQGSVIGIVCRRDGDCVAVEVFDRGAGMTEEQQRRAFDRFWRGSAQPDGFGLGLAVVARLASASGGHVELDSGPGGRGTTARLVLDAAPAGGARHPAPAAS